MFSWHQNTTPDQTQRPAEGWPQGATRGRHTGLWVLGTPQASSLPPRLRPKGGRCQPAAWCHLPGPWCPAPPGQSGSGRTAGADTPLPGPLGTAGDRRWKTHASGTDESQPRTEGSAGRPQPRCTQNQPSHSVPWLHLEAPPCHPPWAGWYQQASVRQRLTKSQKKNSKVRCHLDRDVRVPVVLRGPREPLRDGLAGGPPNIIRSLSPCWGAPTPGGSSPPGTLHGTQTTPWEP